MNDRVVSRAILGAGFVFIGLFFMAGCGQSDWQVVTAGEQVYRVNAKTGEVFVLTKTPVVAVTYEGKFVWLKLSK